MSFEVRNQKAVDMLVEQFKMAFMPETNRERALSKMRDEMKDSRDAAVKALVGIHALAVEMWKDGKFDQQTMTARMEKVVSASADVLSSLKRCTNCGSAVKGGICQNYGCE